MIFGTTTRLDFVVTSGIDLVFSVAAVTDTGAALSYFTNFGASNGATPVTLVPAPALGNTTLRWCSVYNGSGITQVVTVRTDDGVVRTVVRESLFAGQTLQYVPGAGWLLTNAIVPAPITKRISTLRKTGSAAEAAGNWYSFFKDAGIPGASAVGVPGVNGRNVFGSTEPGSLSLAAPVTSWYLTQAAIAVSIVGSPLLYDLVWINSGLVVTTLTEQLVVTPSFPLRDNNGALDGAGYQIGIQWNSASTNAAAISNSTVRYTNSAGVPNRVARLNAAVAGSPIPATPAIGTVVWFDLDAGDEGVQSVQGVTLATSLVAGNISLFVARWVALVPVTLANSADPIQFDAPISVWQDPALYVAYQASTTSATSVAANFFFADQ